MPDKAHRDACWRSILQQFDMTLGAAERAMELLQRAREGMPLVNDPSGDDGAIEQVMDAVSQIPYLIARIRELEREQTKPWEVAVPGRMTVPQAPVDPDAWPPRER